jgi:tRNA(Ile)-lysidine synthase
MSRWISDPDIVMVAVSGGADSVALLRALVETIGNSRLTAAHLNHQLRGNDSDEDEEFVRTLCAKLQVPFQSLRLNVGTVAVDSGRNLESVAREQRYRWFRDLAITKGVRFVATGHTADDQAETVLMRILRGTGLQGLRGIAPVRDLGYGTQVVRPLLTSRRSDVLRYLESLNQDYCTDESNFDLGYQRNRVRRKLLPTLAVENPAIVEHLSQLAEQAAEAFSEIAAAARTLLASAELPEAGDLRILRRGTFTEASLYLACEALRILWRRENWPIDAMRRVDWERTIQAIQSGGSVDLPGPIHVRCAGNVAQIGRAS